MIQLKPYGVAFDEQELVNFIKASSRPYMVQGQKMTVLASHPKPSSLDVWLRHKFYKIQDTKLADNYVLDALVATGLFEISKEICPNSDRPCKSIKLL
jgi:hypothetical protein